MHISSFPHHGCSPYPHRPFYRHPLLTVCGVPSCSSSSSILNTHPYLFPIPSGLARPKSKTLYFCTSVPLPLSLILCQFYPTKREAVALSVHLCLSISNCTAFSSAPWLLTHTHTNTLTLTRLSPLNPPLLERHLTHCLARSFPSRLTRRSPRLDSRLVLSSLSQQPRCSVVGQSSLAHQHCHLGLFLVVSLKRKGATHTPRQQRTHSGEVVAAYISEPSSSRPTAQSWNPPPVLQYLLDSSPELETVGIILHHLHYFIAACP
ncbi:uncharacterized protein BDZ83DRAFT_281855 [Colletotrichum acutatum]|uniref:Uncharacterized protein n=1 Tax=Glomerella acutata TaxID=27357 RepID=A0AAD8XI93_GLOAC|nr:uncharacterized protein BDZ83DRAFT_281855 [Colletotrichum acutatum]KAK1725758.1 hypothetical protein BDZ83DRAFT_281855 [Colletotrichum acutatum]